MPLGDVLLSLSLSLPAELPRGGAREEDQPRPPGALLPDQGRGPRGLDEQDGGVRSHAKELEAAVVCLEGTDTLLLQDIFCEFMERYICRKKNGTTKVSKSLEGIFV